MTTFSIAQSLNEGGADPAEVTVVSPTEGNLLLAIASERSGTGQSAHSVTGGGTWTKRVAIDQELSDANARHSVTVWERVVGASEGNSTVSFDDGTGNSKALSVLEVEPSASYSFSFVEEASDHSGTSHWDGTSSGNTSSISGTDLFEIAIGACRNSAFTLTAVTFDTQTDSNTLYNGGNNGRSHAYAIEASGQSGGVKSAGVNSDGAGHEGAVAVLVFEDGGVGGQTITGSDLVDGDTFGAGTISAGAVSITGAAFSDADAFGSGGISQSVTVSGSAHVDADVFHTGSVAPGPVTVAGTIYAGVASYGAGIVSPGGASIVGAVFIDADGFYGGAITPGAASIAGAVFPDADTFHSGTVTVGTTIGGAALLDTDSFGSGVITAGVTGINGSVFADGDTFHSGTVAPGAAVIAGSLHLDPEVFGAGALATVLQISGASLTAANQFGSGVLTPGTAQVIGSILADLDQFGAGIITGGVVVDQEVPAERVLSVPAELRTLMVEPETRSITIPS